MHAYIMLQVGNGICMQFDCYIFAIRLFLPHMFVKPSSTTLYTQLVLSKRYDLWLVPMSMKDVWKSAIETSGEQFVTVDLTQMMPGQRVAKLDTLENLLVSSYLL